MAGPRMSLRTFKRLIAATVAMVLLTAGLWWSWRWWDESRFRCAEGVVRMEEGGECVGVTDGAHSFAGHLDKVSRKIWENNKKVLKEADERPYVSIAYLTSYIPGEGDSNSSESVRRELQGVYLAQYRNNQGDLKAVPRIRVLLANVGSEARHWEHTVDELIARKNSERLVAVTGLGPSTKLNRYALKKLSKNGLATVASTMTATDIRSIRGFVRVTPTNRDEARAAVEYLRRERIRTAVVVKDVDGENLYAHTLGEDFTREFSGGGGRRLLTEARTFDSSIAAAWENELSHISGQLCHYEPQVVYFAGRGRHLTHFLDALANRHCQDWRVMVMTGDDTTNLTARQLDEAARHGIRVLYTGLAHPDMWRDAPEDVSPASIGHFQEGGLLDRWFPNDPREDGQAMMAHDAMLTAATGARMAVSADGGVTDATGETVGRMFRQMAGDERVPGASGFLTFRNSGDPHQRAVPILRLERDGIPVFVESVLTRG
ncbi:MAG TPA: ABC transporter substrate-binding protein [Streptomyces sp.]|nr:ABC transporter substrate-binding protein [Streptomyces sp.]